MQTARANDRIAYAAAGAAASLLIMVLAFWRLLVPLLAALLVADLVIFLAAGLVRLVVGAGRYRLRGH